MVTNFGQWPKEFYLCFKRQNKIFAKSPSVTQGRAEVWCCSGQKASFATPCSNLRSLGSKCTVLNKKRGTSLGRLGSRGIMPHPPVVMALVWQFATKCAAVKFPEPWILNHFSELTDNGYVGSAMWPECPTKDRRATFFWLNSQESSPEVVQGQVQVTTPPTLLGPVLVWSQQNFLKLLMAVRYSKSSWGCCPSDPPSRKSGHANEWNE